MFGMVPPEIAYAFIGFCVLVALAMFRSAFA